MHVDEGPAPMVEEAVPAAQLRQPLALAEGWYVPTLHSEQLDEPPLAEYKPARHAAQVAEVTAPMVEDAVPTTQATHVVAPVASW